MTHRHATDRVETFVVAECPEGCDAKYTIESEGKEDAVDDLVAKVNGMFDTCPACGADMATLRKTEQTEVLE